MKKRAGRDCFDELIRKGSVNLNGCDSRVSGKMEPAFKSFLKRLFLVRAFQG
ncbi:MAG: hypothetical protein PQJ58_16810 [Spirochaetales bacterium]|nr:hypothetical protein [Spirochaetales bacterium]